MIRAVGGTVVFRAAFIADGAARFGTTVVIDIGGVFAARADALELLEAAVREAAARGDRLVPDAARLLVDRDYVLFAVGLLASRHPDAATSLALRSLGEHGN